MTRGTETSKRAAALPRAVAQAVQAAEDLKARGLLVLDLRPVSDTADFFIIASGTSDAHVRGIADAVVSALGRQSHDPHHIEGVQGGRWVLLDYVDFVVHLFHPETRTFYQLERLWGDAPVVFRGNEHG
jgi:ribosome-associated protein